MSRVAKMIATPGAIVAAASTTYVLAVLGLAPLIRSFDTRTKFISSVHAAVSTSVVLYALSKPWPIATNDIPSSWSSRHLFLDDSHNPMIHGRSNLGNAITAWETGYLLYDTIVLGLFERKDTVTLTHHILIVGALAYLQVVIHRHEERGIWIIIALILMNASTPLLHLRWWRRKRTGRSDARLDILFAAAFAACRLGTVVYILRKYGLFHSLGAFDAFQRQRTVCKVGTGALFLGNLAWWLQLVATISRPRRIKESGSG